jgi:hypothetical protein
LLSSVFALCFFVAGASQPAVDARAAAAFQLLKANLAAQLKKEQWSTMAGLFPTTQLPGATRQGFKSAGDLLDWMSNTAVVSSNDVGFLKRWLGDSLVGAAFLLPLVNQYERDYILTTYDFHGLLLHWVAFAYAGAVLQSSG